MLSAERCMRMGFFGLGFWEFSSVYAFFHGGGPIGTAQQDWKIRGYGAAFVRILCPKRIQASYGDSAARKWLEELAVGIFEQSGFWSELLGINQEIGKTIFSEGGRS